LSREIPPGGAQKVAAKVWKETIQWYLDNVSWMSDVTSGTYCDYYAAMYDEELL
jgi:dTDP-D-glucose 4,6-dehydratase